MKKNIGVSVVIPSFNNKNKLFRLLESVKKSKYSPLQTIVVDNSPTNKVIIAGRKKYKWVKWIDAGRKNIGQAMTYNLGFANANKSYHILYCDEDVILTPRLIGILVKKVNKEKKVGVVTPMILYLEDKSWVNQAGAEVNLKTGKVWIGWGPKGEFLKAKKVQGSGTTMLFTRELVNKIGGFEDWNMCYFDPEYCVRALKAGFENWYEPTAICYHDQPKDNKLWRPRVLSRAYLLGRNRTLFMRRHGNVVTYSLFLPFLLGYYLIESIHFKIFKKWIELIRGSVSGYFYPLKNDLYVPLPKI